jgi:spore germination cell wall hydrolase CwlJ-like protein
MRLNKPAMLLYRTMKAIYRPKPKPRRNGLAIAILAALLLLIGAALAHAESIEVLTIAYEASGESLEGQIAVASVIKTRMAQKGRSAKAVCLARAQFSAWDAYGRPTQRRTLKPSELTAARMAWEAAKPGIFNHYAALGCKPAWIKAAKASKKIGGHIFYQL